MSRLSDRAEALLDALVNGTEGSMRSRLDALRAYIAELESSRGGRPRYESSRPMAADAVLSHLRAGGEGHSIGSIARATNNTYGSVASAIRYLVEAGEIDWHREGYRRILELPKPPRTDA